MNKNSKSSEIITDGHGDISSNPKKRPYQKPELVEIDLSGNSDGKLPNFAENTVLTGGTLSLTLSYGPS